jgi:hypothetical protein
MKDKKLERALYGPSVFEVTLGAVLSLGLGAVLAVGYLLYKPVETVKQLPKEADRVPGQVYFLEGSKDTGKAKQWRTKRKQLMEAVPSEIVLIEDELNAWFAPEAPTQKTAAKPATGKEGEPAPEAPVPDELVTWSHPTFRIADNQMHVSCTATLNPLRLFTLDVPLIVQASGDFVKTGDTFVYAPTTLLVGSLPVHRIPGATTYLMKRARAAQEAALSEQAQAAWARIADIGVDGRTLKVAIQ